MKRIPLLLVLLTTGWPAARAALPATNAAPAGRMLIIDPSSMPIAAGKATLTIGALQRTGGVYTGEYEVKVSPYFFKSEKGRLAIMVSDESLASVSQGKVVAIIGTATGSGQGGKVRPIESTATPAPNDPDRGMLKLSFMSGDRKMIFEPAYHFAEQGTLAALVQTTETNAAPQPRYRVPISHREALEASTKRP